MESKKTLILSLPLKIIFGSILTLSLACAKTSSNIPEVDENLIETTLPNLIYGFKCNNIRDISHFDPSVFWVKDGETINSQKIPNGIHYIRFAGRILEGGIYDDKSNTYISPNKEFMYFF